MEMDQPVGNDGGDVGGAGHGGGRGEALQCRIADEEFEALLRERLAPLQRLLACVLDLRGGEAVATRRMIGHLLLESALTEALLDEYGAGLNRRWHRFRELMAALKSFAGVAQGIAHLDRRLLAYRLIAVEGDFARATRHHLDLVWQVLRRVATSLLDEARALGVATPVAEATCADFGERYPPGRLPRDLADRLPRSDAAATITRLATEFLNLEARGEFLHDAARVAPAEYAECFPRPINEERLRALTFRFHNLQSLYDTHVAGTSTERADDKLGVLRGHASVILHLLRIATDLAHYHERHIHPFRGDPARDELAAMETTIVLDTLFAYAAAYASAYLEQGQRLCHDILRGYAEIGRVEVPVPAYRGFHVRPSNLVARIVRHYGSEVRMELDGQSFDAASPLNLFRANEDINARKRRWLCAELARVVPPGEPDRPEAIAAAVEALLARLAGEGRIVIYRLPLQFSPEAGRRDGGVLGNAVAEIAHLQASGQLDIRTDLTVAFVGDRRVLADLDILARHGYGEDAFGNNVVLPAELSYLKR